MKEKSRNQILLSRQLSRIMIIDDEHVLLNAIKKYLMAKEFNIITCNSGKEALRRVKKEKIDLLIVDILMCDMDGYEFVKNLKKGMIVSEPDIKRIRPGFGLEPKYFDKILGKKLKCDVERGDPVSFEHFFWD